MGDSPNKTCSKCLEIKSLEEFYKSTVHKDGIKSRCKICAANTTKEYRFKNKSKIKEYLRKYRRKNKSRTTENNQRYYLLNKHKIKDYQRNYNLKNRAKINERIKKRRRSPVEKISHSLRERIRQVLKGRSKSDSSINLLGCSGKALKVYLESKFQEGMTWENYGMRGWHIDHIKPCASFNMLDPEQQKACFHYSNLQPLWAHENLSKGDKI